MAATIGEKLRQAREAKGIDLRDLADQTRISINYLRAIEADDYRTLPGGIFNKGFVRSFAKAVGVDEKEALADYSSLMAEQGTTAELPTSRKIEYLGGDQRRSSMLPLLAAIMVLGLLGVGIYYGVQYVQTVDFAALTASPKPTPTANANANAALPQPTQQPPPSVADGLKVQLKALNIKVNVETTADGKKAAFDINAGETKDLNANTALKIRFAKSLVNELQMTVNGRPANFPPPNPKMNGLEFEINKENFAQFLQPK